MILSIIISGGQIKMSLAAISYVSPFKTIFALPCVQSAKRFIFIYMALGTPNNFMLSSNIKSSSIKSGVTSNVPSHLFRSDAEWFVIFCFFMSYLSIHLSLSDCKITSFIPNKSVYQGTKTFYTTIYSFIKHFSSFIRRLLLHHCI